MKNKPFTLILREFDDKLIDTINGYKLPAQVIIHELEKIINIIVIQDNEEIEKYNKEQEEKKNAKD
jgi:hypothetical protein